MVDNVYSKLKLWKRRRVFLFPFKTRTNKRNWRYFLNCKMQRNAITFTTLSENCRFGKRANRSLFLRVLFEVSWHPHHHSKRQQNDITKSRIDVQEFHHVDEILRIIWSTESNDAPFQFSKKEWRGQKKTVYTWLHCHKVYRHVCLSEMLRLGKSSQFTCFFFFSKVILLYIPFPLQRRYATTPHFIRMYKDNLGMYINMPGSVCFCISCGRRLYTKTRGSPCSFFLSIVNFTSRIRMFLT